MRVLLEGVWTSWAEPRGWFSTEGCVEMCLAPWAMSSEQRRYDCLEVGRQFQKG